jgi:hypothetical protein
MTDQLEVLRKHKMPPHLQRVLDLKSKLHVKFGVNQLMQSLVDGKLYRIKDFSYTIDELEQGIEPRYIIYQVDDDGNAMALPNIAICQSKFENGQYFPRYEDEYVEDEDDGPDDETDEEYMELQQEKLGYTGPPS